MESLMEKRRRNRALMKFKAGDWVKFTSADGIKVQIGRVKEVNDRFVLVVYRCGGDWENYTDHYSQATAPEMLELIDEPEGFNG